jgi:hypothetical protein
MATATGTIITPMAMITTTATNEAAPQTDEACGGCGSGRRLMTSFW